MAYQRKDKIMDIKKLIRVLIVVAVASFFVGAGISHGRQNKPREFEILHSFKFSSSNRVDTDLDVIVNVEDYDIDEMMIKVKKEQERINGKSDTLTIELYNSIEDWENCKCAGKAKFWNTIDD